MQKKKIDEPAVTQGVSGGDGPDDEPRRPQMHIHRDASGRVIHSHFVGEADNSSANPYLDNLLARLQERHEDESDSVISNEE